MKTAGVILFYPPFSKFPGRYALYFFKESRKVSGIVYSTFSADIFDAVISKSQQALSKSDSLVNDVVVDGCPKLFLEQPCQIVFINIEVFRQRIQIYFFSKMFIYIFFISFNLVCAAS